jgi:hypothetical protein
MKTYELFRSLLSDEGISEKSFNLMYDYVDMLCNEFQGEEAKKLHKLIAAVEATDGDTIFPKNLLTKNRHPCTKTSLS